jgi:AMMECR1 domain-containing protein
VATEWGFDREAFLGEVARKAGLPREAWKEPETKIWRFSAEVFAESEPKIDGGGI